MDFVGIKAVCRNCKQLFSSGNKLHKHLRGECSQKAKAISKKVYSVTRLAIRATAPASPCTPTPTNAPITPRDSCNAISIIESIMPKSDLGFEYTFCNWNYAMVLAALKSNFRSYDKTLSEEHIETPPINANWISTWKTASSGCNGCIDTRCDTTLINQDGLKT